MRAVQDARLLTILLAVSSSRFCIAVDLASPSDADTEVDMQAMLQLSKSLESREGASPFPYLQDVPGKSEGERIQNLLDHEKTFTEKKLHKLDEVARWFVSKRSPDSVRKQGRTCTITSEEQCDVSSLDRLEWTAVLPTGKGSQYDTFDRMKCIDGSPYLWQFRPGDDEGGRKLLVLFDGGGACWNAASTSLPTDMIPCTTRAVANFNLTGLMDHRWNSNPFRNYSMLYLPSCSGDFFIGDTIRNYSFGLVGPKAIQTGFWHAEAAFSWLMANHGYQRGELKHAVFSGKSTGALALQYWSSYLLDRMKPKAAIFIPDSYAGVFPSQLQGSLYQGFGLCSLPLAPEPVATKCRSDVGVTVQDFVCWTLKEFPDVHWKQIQSREDAMQRSLFDVVALSAGDTISPELKLTANGHLFAALTSQLHTPYREFPNWHVFLVDGYHHTFITSLYSGPGLTGGSVWSGPRSDGRGFDGDFVGSPSILEWIRDDRLYSVCSENHASRETDCLKESRSLGDTLSRGLVQPQNVSQEPSFTFMEHEKPKRLGSIAEFIRNKRERTRIPDEKTGRYCTITAENRCEISGLEPGDWTVILPTGNGSRYDMHDRMKCIDGSSYLWQFKPGRSGQLLVLFGGGGACWNLASTSLPRYFIPCSYKAVPDFSSSGIMNSSWSSNPFRDYSMLYLPQCSGDFFIGNVVRDYSFGLSGSKAVQMGYWHVHSALLWLMENRGYKRGELNSVVFSGQSTGALGLQYWSGHLVGRMEPKKALVIPDSHAGVFAGRSEGWINQGFGLCDLPIVPDELVTKCKFGTSQVGAFVEWTLKTFPDVHWMQIQAKEDRMQRLLSDAVAWSFGDAFANEFASSDKGPLFYAAAKRVFERYHLYPNWHVFYHNSGHHTFTTSLVHSKGLGEGSLLSGPSMAPDERTKYRSPSILHWIENQSRINVCENAEHFMCENVKHFM